jgi:hypothetical protein
MRLTTKQKGKRLRKALVAWIHAYIDSLREGLEQHNARVALQDKARQQKPTRKGRKR